MKIYPKLNSLKQKLNIQQVNTERIMSYRGIEFSDVESLHAIGTIDNKIVFKSGLEMPWIQSFREFRGQIQDFDTCKSNLFREGLIEKNYSNIFLQICRTIAFETLLDKHPYIKLLKNVRIDEHEIYINTTALAQHYELQTPYLDLTDNFDVASFFATSKYNAKTRKYEPYMNSSHLGVIFVLNSVFVNNGNIKFEHIGWQGLPRPEEQRASIYRLFNNEDLNDITGVKKFYFQHSHSASKRIWNQFNKGKALFPEDSATILANECKELKCFTQNEIDNAIIRSREWTDIELSKEKIVMILNRLNIEITDFPTLDWKNMLETNELYWKNKLDEVFKRTKTRF